MCAVETLCTQSSSGPHAQRVFCSVECPCVAGAPREAWGAGSCGMPDREALDGRPPTGALLCLALTACCRLTADRRSPPVVDAPSPCRCGGSAWDARGRRLWRVRCRLSALGSQPAREERIPPAQCAAAITAPSDQTREPSSGRPSTPRRNWGAPKHPHGSRGGLCGGSVSDPGGLLRASRGATAKRGSQCRAG